MNKKNPWHRVRKREWMEWFSDWMISSMVLKAHGKFGKMPKFIRTDGNIKDCKDGSGKLKYEVRF